MKFSADSIGVIASVYGHEVPPMVKDFFDRAAHQQLLVRMSQMPADAWQHLLRVTEACVGCGVCERVCPSASIHVADGKAVHTPGNCQTCLACAHACPQKAIQLTIPEVKLITVSGLEK